MTWVWVGLVAETSVGTYLFVYDVLVGRLRKPAPSAWMSVDAASRISRVVGTAWESRVNPAMASSGGRVQSSSDTRASLGAVPIETDAHFAQSQ